MAPLIAITTYPADDASLQRVNLPREYVDSVRRAGGRAVLVAPGEPDPAGLLDVVDGLVLTGGGDIATARWDGPEHETVYMTDEARDSFEITLARLAVEETGHPGQVSGRRAPRKSCEYTFRWHRSSCGLGGPSKLCPLPIAEPRPEHRHDFVEC